MLLLFPSAKLNFEWVNIIIKVQGTRYKGEDVRLKEQESVYKAPV